MSADKMRWDFEAWCDASDYSITRAIVGGTTSDSYLSFDTQLAWQAWKASREQLAVELPRSVAWECVAEHKPRRFSVNGMAAMERARHWDEEGCATDVNELMRSAEVVRALEAAGVRVKP